jgi:hypothetical protein
MKNNRAHQSPGGSGVKHEALLWCDCYTGKKEALIAAGVAKVEWFPAGVVRDKRGRMRHTFDFEIEGLGQVKLRQVEPSYREWSLYLPISEEEEEKRLKDHKAKGEARRREWEANEEAEARATLEPFAAYAAGDRAILYIPGNDAHLAPLEVVKGHGLHKVADPQDKLYGYIVIVRGDKETSFVFAHQLRDYADKPSHLKLAVDNGR